MSNFIKKLFGTLTEKPWESNRAKIDDAHIGKTFDLSVQTSAVIIIFGIATVLFSLIFTGYIYSIPPEQDTRYLLKPNFLWINTFVLFVIAYFFSKKFPNHYISLRFLTFFKKLPKSTVCINEIWTVFILINKLPKNYNFDTKCTALRCNSYGFCIFSVF